MKKIMTRLLIVIVAIALLLPGICGYYFRHQYLLAIKEINADKHVIISVSNYQLGWLSSTATIDIYPSNVMRDETKITLKQFIKHGPVFFTSVNNKLKIDFVGIRTDVYLPTAIQRLFYPHATEPMVIAHLHSIINFAGNYYSKMVAEPLTTSVMTWQGLSSKVLLKIDDTEIAHVKYNLAFSDLSVATDSTALIPNTKLSLHPFYISMTGDRLENNDWNLGFYFQMPIVMIDAPDDWKFHLDNANLNQEFESQNNYYHSKTVFSFGKFTMPGFFLDDSGPLTCNLMINHLDANKLSQFNYLIQTAEEAPLTNLFNQLDTWVTQAITRDTFANFSGNLVTPLGYVNINATITYPSDKPLPVTFKQLVDDAKIKMDVEISSSFMKILADQFADVIFPYIDHSFQIYPYKTALMEKHPINLVAQWELKGLLIPQDDHYLLTITRENGEIYINGKPLSALQPMPKAASEPYKKINYD